MNPPHKNIIDFLKNNQIATVCFTDTSNNPYCINCFYCFNEEHNVLIFKSSYGTTHEAFIKENKHSAGTIVANQIKISKLKGLQFTGKILGQQQIQELKLHTSYIKKIPISKAMPGYIWGV